MCMREMQWIFVVLIVSSFGFAYVPPHIPPSQNLHPSSRLSPSAVRHTQYSALSAHNGNTEGKDLRSGLSASGKIRSILSAPLRRRHSTTAIFSDADDDEEGEEPDAGESLNVNDIFAEIKQGERGADKAPDNRVKSVKQQPTQPPPKPPPKPPPPPKKTLTVSEEKVDFSSSRLEREKTPKADDSSRLPKVSLPSMPSLPKIPNPFAPPPPPSKEKIRADSIMAAISATIAGTLAGGVYDLVNIEDLEVEQLPYVILVSSVATGLTIGAVSNDETGTKFVPKALRRIFGGITKAVVNAFNRAVQRKVDEVVAIPGQVADEIKAIPR